MNNQKDLGLQHLAKYLNKCENTCLETSKVNTNWLNETSEEYNKLTMLQTKILNSISIKVKFEQKKSWRTLKTNLYQLKLLPKI